MDNFSAFIAAIFLYAAFAAPVAATTVNAEPTAIVSVTDYIGSGNKLVAVPFSQVLFDGKKPSPADSGARTSFTIAGNEVNYMSGGGG